jgi:hypothetical protein
MLHIRFATPEERGETSPAGSLSSFAAGGGSASGTTLAHAQVDPGVLMKLIARNAKRGAQFTPQGVFRWPLTSAKAEDVIAETRTLLESLEPAQP